MASMIVPCWLSQICDVSRVPWQEAFVASYVCFVLAHVSLCAMLTSNWEIGLEYPADATFALAGGSGTLGAIVASALSVRAQVGAERESGRRWLNLEHMHKVHGSAFSREAAVAPPASDPGYRDFQARRVQMAWYSWQIRKCIGVRRRQEWSQLFHVFVTMCIGEWRFVGE